MPKTNFQIIFETYLRLFIKIFLGPILFLFFLQTWRRLPQTFAVPGFDDRDEGAALNLHGLDGLQQPGHRAEEEAPQNRAGRAD
jgi:hypothetical protein